MACLGSVLLREAGGEAGRWSVWALAASMVATACLLAIPSPAFAAGLAEPPCVYRLYNRWSGEHLFTASHEEYSQLEDIGWNGEGLAWYAPVESASPVYRLYNPYSGDHHYTREKREYDHLGSIGWRQEGVAFYSSEEKDGVPVYRLYNPWLTAGTHLFTTDEEEYDSLGGIGWNKEDVAWYGLNRIASGTFGEGCTWTRNGRGTLTVSPTNGVSGTMSKLLDSFPQDKFDVYNVVIAEGVKAPEDSSSLFSGVHATAIDAARLDVSGVTNMSCMFDGCPSLSDVSPLSGWDTSSVTDMHNMFDYCSSLSDATPLEGWEVSSSADKSGAFPDGCKVPSWYAAERLRPEAATPCAARGCPGRACSRGVGRGCSSGRPAVDVGDGGAAAVAAHGGTVGRVLSCGRQH